MKLRLLDVLTGLCNRDQDAPSPSGGRIPKLQDVVLGGGVNVMMGETAHWVKVNF